MSMSSEDRAAHAAAARLAAARVRADRTVAIHVETGGLDPVEIAIHDGAHEAYRSGMAPTVAPTVAPTFGPKGADGRAPMLDAGDGIDRTLDGRAIPSADRPRWTVAAAGGRVLMSAVDATADHGRADRVNAPERDPALRAAAARAAGDHETADRLDAWRARSGQRADRPIPDRIVREPGIGALESVKVRTDRSTLADDATADQIGAFDAVKAAASDPAFLQAARLQGAIDAARMATPTERAILAETGARALALPGAPVALGTSDPVVAGILASVPDGRAVASAFTSALAASGQAARYADATDVKGALVRTDRIKVRTGGTSALGAEINGAGPMAPDAGAARAGRTADRAGADLAALVREHARATGPRRKAIGHTVHGTVKAALAAGRTDIVAAARAAGWRC